MTPSIPVGAVLRPDTATTLRWGKNTRREKSKTKKKLFEPQDIRVIEIMAS